METVIHIVQVGRLRLLWMINPSRLTPERPTAPLPQTASHGFPKGTPEWVVQVRCPCSPTVHQHKGKAPHYDERSELVASSF